MPELHHAYLRLLRERDGLYVLLQSSRSHGLQDRAKVRHLWAERVDLTEIIASLVAKDDDDHWTTVFDADTRLPADYQAKLNVLVEQT